MPGACRGQDERTPVTESPPMTDPKNPSGAPRITEERMRELLAEEYEAAGWTGYAVQLRERADSVRHEDAPAVSLRAIRRAVEEATTDIPSPAPQDGGEDHVQSTKKVGRRDVPSYGPLDHRPSCNCPYCT
jgi:hypothetical protein